MDEFYDLLHSRRSVRSFEPTPVGEEELMRALKAATSAPSAHNRQPWRFAVLQHAAEKEALAEAMGERLATDRSADGDDPRAIDRDVQRSYARISGAAAVIVVCLAMADMDAYPDERRSRAEFMMAVQSVAMASQNLLLALHAEGLGACWMCAPLFAPTEVLQSLDLPPEWIPQGLVILGYPKGEWKERSRSPVSEVAKFL